MTEEYDAGKVFQKTIWKSWAEYVVTVLVFLIAHVLAITAIIAGAMLGLIYLTPLGYTGLGITILAGAGIAGYGVLCSFAEGSQAFSKVGVALYRTHRRWREIENTE